MHRQNKALIHTASAIMIAAITHGGNAFSADWRYHVTTDTFDNVEIRTATLPGDGNSSAMLRIVMRSDGANLAGLTGARFDCFPQCDVRIKFDDATPEVFTASSTRMVSYTISINDFHGVMRKASHAKTMIVRAQTHDGKQDLRFIFHGPIEPEAWDRAKTDQAASATCQANAVKEDYSACMARQASKGR